ncbi:MAG: VWA domain-containing protein, partial [Actinomycetota bacterium]|nr:VWA domain-containing protein [Actinomycetota bacterium]
MRTDTSGPTLRGRADVDAGDSPGDGLEELQVTSSSARRDLACQRVRTPRSGRQRDSPDSRALRGRNPEAAIQRAAAAPDWSGGTRIGPARQAFNDHFGRRGPARGAVVVILSDGRERGDPALVGREMERLARLAHRIRGSIRACRRAALRRWPGGW